MGSRGATALRSTAGVLLGGALTCVAWGALVERHLYTLRRCTVPVLPAGAAPVRVLQLSDLHLAPWQSRRQRWVRALAGLNPDLVVTTGDNCGHSQANVALEFVFEAFQGTPGAFVHGSNDYFSPLAKNPVRYFRRPGGGMKRRPDLDTAGLTRLFSERLGWLDLNNAAGSLTIRGTRFELFGLNDPHIRYDDAARMSASLEELRLNGVDAVAGETPPTRLGVVHAPYQRALNALVDAGAATILAGHTHGGQVCVPGFGALTTNSDLPRGQAKGLSVWSHNRRSAFLHVSAGLGHSIYAPVRFACRPEATLLTLTAARS